MTSNRGSGDLGRAGAQDMAASADQASPRSATGAASVRGTTGRASLTETSAEGLEAHILARIAAICQPGMYAKARQAQVQMALIHTRPHPSYMSHAGSQLVCLLAGSM